MSETKRAVIALGDGSLERVAVIDLLGFVPGGAERDLLAVGFDFLQPCGSAVCKEKILLGDSEFLILHSVHKLKVSELQQLRHKFCRLSCAFG